MKTEQSIAAQMGAEFAEEIRSLKTQFDVFRFMKRLTESWGMRAFLVANLPHHTSLELSASTIITSWPSELLGLYDQQGLLGGSPVLRRMRSSVVPFTHDVSGAGVEAGDTRHRTVTEMFDRFGMPFGVWFCVHEASGARGIVSLCGMRRNIEPAEMAELNLLACHVYDRLAEIRILDSKVNDSLTEREIECLNWTSAGKTSAEISEILLVSEHTVNHYLNRATRKLDAVNRTQAVAKALRLGLIK